MYRFGLGDTTSGAGLYASLVGASGSSDASSDSSSSDTVVQNPYAGILSQYLPVTASASGTAQTFSQWVTANSTLLLVAFAAVGALVALTRVGK